MSGAAHPEHPTRRPEADLRRPLAIVRCGPMPMGGGAPGGDLAVDARFDRAALLPAPAAVADDAAFGEFIRRVWGGALADGHGHVLVGGCEGIGFAGGAPGAGCGADAPEALETRPAGYVPWFGVARYEKAGEGHVDLAIDYRFDPPAPGIFALTAPAPPRPP